MTSSNYNTELPFRQSVAKLPSSRTAQDLTIINAYLKHLEALSSLRESHIRNLCKTVRYEIHDANYVLFNRGQLNTCWYILLSGSVFIESTMYLPRASFGKRTPNNPYRTNECVILEPSEMLVIDYPEIDPLSQCSSSMINESSNDQNGKSLIDTITNDDNDERQILTLQRNLSSRTRQRCVTIGHSNEIHPSMIHSYYSRTSDTSSAYSGSDLMQSSTNGEDSLINQQHETDDESEESSEHSFPVHDHIREALMKEAHERTEDDINSILEFLIHFPAFADLTLNVRRELCKVLVFAHVEKAQTIVMNDGERYDSWSIIINGSVDDETVDGQPIRTLNVGQSFGCGPTLDQYYHRGIMKTKVDDCQFVVIAQNDYYAILNQGEKNIRKIEENGRLIMIKEIRVDDDEQRIPREIVLKAATEKLIDLLIDIQQLQDDPNFVQDFLLTYRTFIRDPTTITKKLFDSFNKNSDFVLCEHITRVILSWVNNHYNDFESNQELHEFLENFDEHLQNHETEYMRSWRHLLNLACFTKATIRTITISRSTRDDVLHFNILGRNETSANDGIFVSKVERNSKAYEAGLRRGDQILNVNGQSFDYVTHARALDILRSATHLSLTVKNNLMGLNEIVNPEKSPARKKRHDLYLYEKEIREKLNLSSPIRSNSTTPTTSPHSNQSPSDPSNSSHQMPNINITPTKHPPLNNQSNDKQKPRALTKRMGLKRAVMQKFKMNKTNRSTSELDTAGLEQTTEPSFTTVQALNQSANAGLNRSSSNPDLSPLLNAHKIITPSIVNVSNLHSNDEDSAFVVKVYRSDQTFKYFPVHKETTAKQLVMLAITEFGITEQSRHYSLCEVSVENGFVKQKRLADQMDNLPERLPIHARYYLKNNQLTESLVPDHLTHEFIREARINFLHLDPLEICAQLTLRDFAMFKSIQPTEYIDHIFKLDSSYGIPHLERFLKLPNEEMYWTITEILRENNLIQRSKIVKHFIKIAKCCKEMKNFNSMFAIISGLDHKTVQRLQATWERVSDKYKKLFEELKSILDLSRNMSVYRNLLKNDLIAPPIIPMFPVCMKDLTFIHLGNQTEDDGLINFEKLRMIAKEIRHIVNMASTSYDISTMVESLTSSSQIFAIFVNQSMVDSSMMNRRNPTTMRLSVTANAKRIYDEALMVKKVKTYLNHMEIIDDEDRLLDLANQHEPAEKENPIDSLNSFDETLEEFRSQTLIRRSKSESVRTQNNESDQTIGADLNSLRAEKNLRSLKKVLVTNVTTLKRRPSPSTSSLSSNSSADRRQGFVMNTTKFGTQSPDAVNKLLRLTDSSHQTKTRPAQKAHHQSTNTLLKTHSPLLSSPVRSATGITGFHESSQNSQNRRHHVGKMRDTNKLSSESSSLNFKAENNGVFIRSQQSSNGNQSQSIKESDSGHASFSSADIGVIGEETDQSVQTTPVLEDFSKNRTNHLSPILVTKAGSANRKIVNGSPTSSRARMQRSKSQNELDGDPLFDKEKLSVDFDDDEQVTAV